MTCRSLVGSFSRTAESVAPRTSSTPSGCRASASPASRKREPLRTSSTSCRGAPRGPRWVERADRGRLAQAKGQRPMNAIRNQDSATYNIPVYEVRLVRARRALRLAEECLPEPRTSARALHALIGLTDREHFACLFVNARHRVTGAHIAAIGAQHAITSLDARVVLRAALAACASAMIVSHNHPSGVMATSRLGGARITESPTADRSAGGRSA